MLSFIFPEVSTEMSAKSYFMWDGALAHSSIMVVDCLKDCGLVPWKADLHQLKFRLSPQFPRPEPLRFIFVCIHERGSE